MPQKNSFCRISDIFRLCSGFYTAAGTVIAVFEYRSAIIAFVFKFMRSARRTNCNRIGIFRITVFTDFHNLPLLGCFIFIGHYFSHGSFFYRNRYNSNKSHSSHSRNREYTISITYTHTHFKRHSAVKTKNRPQSPY